jgi:hypothetical protein
MKEVFLKRLLLIALLLPLTTHAEDYMLTIKDHHFQPIELMVPSGTKIKLRIDNQDAIPEEFDSYSLNREKVIAGHSSATIYIGPLTPGRYPFTGEFHQTTAQGVIIAQ